MKRVCVIFLMMALTCMGLAHAQWVTFINKTGNRLGLVMLDRPFKRSDVYDDELYWLRPGQQMDVNVHERLIGWYQRGLPVSYTVLRRNDKIVAFVEHAGEIKSLHGALRNVPISNSRGNSIIMETKNPNRGEQDCRDCVEDCYYRDGTVEFCSCLDWCWDRTQDMQWILNPGRRLEVLVASGTKIGLSDLYVGREL